MTLEIRNKDTKEIEKDNQSTSLAEDTSSTYIASHLDFRLITELDHLGEHAIIRKQLAELEKKYQSIEKTLADSGVKVFVNKYDIFNMFLENLIETFSSSIKNYRILNEFTEENKLICWIIIPVKKSYKPKDFEEYNRRRLEIFKSIFDFSEKYENCSFSVVSDFEYKKFKNKLDIELEYTISDFLQE